MSATEIAFPNLGIDLSYVPKSFSVFGFSIALYGIVIACGMICGILLASHIAKQTGFDQNIIWDFAIYGIIFGVLGARVYYVVFSWDKYKDDLIQIFNTRNGGLAIYGGVIAAFITLAVFVKRRKINFLTLSDICVPGLALGQAIGRWGNFFNREAFGQYTDNLFAMRLPIDAVRSNDISAALASHIADGTNYIQVHPTFLYESMWNVVLIILMLLLTKRKKFEGEILLLYLGGYGLGRAWIEGLRTDQLWIPGTQIAVSQVLALVLVVFSIVMDLILRNRTKKKATQEADEKKESL